MKNALIITLLLICFISNTPAQTPHGIIASLDSLDKVLLDKKYFFLGEEHETASETVIHYQKLVDLLVKKGVKKFKLYFELPPSWVYFLRKYYDNPNVSEDSIYYKYAAGYRGVFMDSIRKYQNLIDIEFVPLDAEDGGKYNVMNINTFLQEIFEPCQIAGNMPRHFQGIYKTQKEKKIEKWAKEIAADKELMNEYLKCLEPQDQYLFTEEIKTISTIGILHQINLKNAFQHKVRDAYMASNIDSLSSQLGKDEVCIALFGSAHITPFVDTTRIPYLAQCLKKVKRDEIVLLPIVYEYSSLAYINYYNGKWHTDLPKNGPLYFIFDISEMGNVMKDKPFDAILMHNLDVMWRDELYWKKVDAEKEKKKKKKQP